jgi:hypothetical protein
MDMKRIVTDGLRLIAGVLVVGAALGCGLPKASVAAALPPAQAPGTNTQAPADNPTDGAPTTVVAKVSVLRQGQKTTVQVTTRGTPAYHAVHQTDPERVALDFQRARLAIPATTPSSFGPVSRVRAGQFTPDVVRVVIDLKEVSPYRVNLAGNTVTVEFGAAESAANSAPPPRPPSGAKEKAEEPAASAPRSVAPEPPAASATPPASSLTPQPSSLPSRAVRASSKNEPLPIEPDLSNGMLTFRAQNETLRSALGRISAQSGIAIYMGNDLGNEPLTVEFRRYRIDEALRQILKDYDTFFFYAGDDGNQAATSLKAVWVYPEGRGPRFATFK